MTRVVTCGGTDYPIYTVLLLKTTDAEEARDIIMKLNSAGIAIIIILVLFCLAAGCTSSAPGDPGSTKAKLQKVVDLSASAESRMSFLRTMDAWTVDVAMMRENASESGREQREAKKILDEISLDEFPPSIQADINATRIVKATEIEYADMVAGPTSDWIEDVQNISRSDDPVVIAERGKDMREKTLAQRDIQTHVLAELNSIDLTLLSAEHRDQIVRMRLQTEAAIRNSNETFVAEWCIKKCKPGERVKSFDCECRPANE
jgi:hypothetical protein